MKKKTERLERGTYVGGHGAAKIVGMHPYGTAGELFANMVLGVSDEEKTNREINEDWDRPNVLRRGRICEDGVISFIEEQILKLPPGTLERDMFFMDEERPFMAGTIDAAEMNEDGTVKHIHEITVTSSLRVDDNWGKSEDPAGCAKYKRIQDLYYQGLTNAEGGTVWLFIADKGELRRYPVPRSEEAIDVLFRKVEEFYLNHLLTGEPPDPTEGLEDIEAWAKANPALDAIFHDEVDEEIGITPEVVEAAFDYDAARTVIKQVDTDKSAASAKLKAALGKATKVKGEGVSVTWRRNKAKPKTDYQKVTQDLAAAYAELSGEDLSEVLARFEQPHTVVRPGGRVLRVTVKHPDESQAEE